MILRRRWFYKREVEANIRISCGEKPLGLMWKRRFAQTGRLHWKNSVRPLWQSHPLRGAWIEILTGNASGYSLAVAPLTGCVDWNFSLFVPSSESVSSHPLRGAWIEIWFPYCIHLQALVAPLTGCVDWNSNSHAGSTGYQVAPLTGCVDWNRSICRL